MAKAFSLPTGRTEQMFSYSAPAATTVLLVGDFTHWQKNPIAMDKMQDGIWRVAVALPRRLAVPNSFGGSNAVLSVNDAGG